MSNQGQPSGGGPEKQAYNSPSRQETLARYVAAAEELMRQMKSTEDPPEIKALRSRVHQYLDKAEQIKSTTDDDWIRMLRGDEAVPQLLSKEHAESSPSSARSHSEQPSNLPSIQHLSLNPSKPHALAPPSSSGPKSTRKPSTREEIIVLRGSQFNGGTFRPWKAPSPELFQGESFQDNPPVHLSGRQQDAIRGWGPPSAAFPPPNWPHSPLGSKGAIDLIQHAATDCSVVASLCTIAGRHQRGFPKLLTSRILPYDHEADTPCLSPNHKHIIKLNINGCEREVTIDDLLPISKSAEVLYVVDRNNPSLFWPALVEKAYLKARGGYDFPGSNSATDLWILIGWVPDLMFLQSNDLDADGLWARIHTAFHYGDVLVTLGTGHLSPEVMEEYGLAESHDYPVLNMKEMDGQRIMTVKNPWSSGGVWKGVGGATTSGMASSSRFPAPETEQASQSSELLENEGMQANQTQLDELPNNSFHIKFEDVLQNFKTIYLSWNPELWKYRQDIHFEWDLTRKLSSGFADRPQFQVKVQENDKVFLLLTKHFQDSKSSRSGQSPGYISLYAFDNDGQIVFLHDGYIEHSMFVDSPHTLLRAELQGGKSYTIVPGEIDLPARKHGFTLSAFSSPPLALEPAVSPYAHTRSIQHAWTEETAGGNASSPRYYENPQFALDVLEPTKISVCLQTGVEGINLHVKVLFGQSRRAHKLKRRDIVVDSGDYRTHGTVAQIDDLDPGKYTIICSTFTEKELAPFSLRVDSTQPVQLKPIPSQHAGRIRTPLANCTLTHPRTKMACPLYPSRLARTYIVVQFLHGFLYGPDGEAQPMAQQGRGVRSPIRASVELGTGPDRKFLITSGDGSYTDDEMGAMTEEFDLTPDLRNTDDVWLVLERLPRPNCPEEWYRVEVYTDVPDAFVAGPWRSH